MSRASFGAMVLATAAAACAGQRATVPALSRAEQTSTSPAAALSKQLAPQALGEANAMLALARSARESGDDVGAALLAERAIALYQRALMLSRTARATLDLAEASSALAKAETEGQSLDTQRVAADARGEALERRLFLARESLAPKASGATDPIREAARLSAARSLAQTARLLCGAATLIDPATSGLDAERAKLDELDKLLAAAPKIAPIDAAARERASCLASLTAARRAQAGAVSAAADPLLAELSAAGVAPVRDERGIVVTLRDVFAGRALSKDAQAQLAALGRVAAAHAAIAVQIVVHDASAQPPGSERGELARTALVAAGARSDRVGVEMAGTRAPIVDPGDAKNRGRNARVDVVFVTGD